MYSLRYTLVSIILSAAIMYGMINENLIALSAPSIFATWITIYLKNRKIL
jgi:urea transporter